MYENENYKKEIEKKETLISFLAVLKLESGMVK